MIYVKNLSFAYQKDLVLDEVSFRFSSKDFLAIIGPNGGGKSTLLKLILGLLKPDSGEIEIEGKNSLSYVPQNTNSNQIFPMTCLEVVLMGRLKRSWFNFYNKDDYKKANEALDMVGVSHLAHKNINSLSGGQKQRVLIARALCGEAKVILLDEPTSSIDTSGQIQVYSLLKEINKNVGIIVVSHDINIALSFANKVAHVNKKLFMHNVKENEAKQKLLLQLNASNAHICPIEILNASSKKGYIWRS